MDTIIKKESNTELKVLLTDGQFRVCNLTALKNIEFDKNKVTWILENLPLEEGLAIEKFVDNDETEIIAKILFDDETGELLFEDCNFRSVDILYNITPVDLTSYLKCVDFAVNFMVETYDLLADIDVRGVC